jgi:histidinol-phosphatase (PHP family)
VLTDYHVHLRVDDPASTPAASAFTAANAERYREVATERGIAELGVAEHVYRFTAALDVWNHPLWVESAHDDIDEYVRFVREETDLRLGIEADFIPGREDRMRSLLATAQGPQLAHGIDALLGSAWDDELEPYRLAGEGAPVTFLHQVV